MRLKRLLDDERGQILGRIIKIGLIVVIIGLIISEVGPVIWFRISTIQDAEDLASAVAFDFKLHRDEAKARGEGADRLRLMGYSDDEIRASNIEFLPPNIPTKDKTSIRATVVKYANTLITRHIGFLKKFSTISTSKEASVQ